MKNVKRILLLTIGIIPVAMILLVAYSYVFNAAFLSNDDQIELNCKQGAIAPLTSLPANIIAPKNIENQILFVLNQYPELANTGNEIHFVKGNINTTMATQPKIDWHVFDAKTRNYVIIINNNENKSTFNFNELDEVYQIAWIAHEFGHVVDYKNRSSLSLIGMGVNYLLNPDFKKSVELFATRSAVYHGFGAETFSSVSFAFDSPIISDSYKQQMKESYLNPDGISRLREEYESRCDEH